MAMEKHCDEVLMMAHISKCDNLVYMLSDDVAVYVAEFLLEFHPWVHIAGLDVLCHLEVTTCMYTNPYMLLTLILYFMFSCFIICHILCITCMIYGFNKVIWIFESLNHGACHGSECCYNCSCLTTCWHLLW